MRNLGADLRALDVRVLRELRTRGHSAPAEAVVIGLARAGEHGLVWHGMAVAGLALDGERRLVYLRATGAVALTSRRTRSSRRSCAVPGLPSRTCRRLRR